MNRNDFILFIIGVIVLPFTSCRDDSGDVTLSQAESILEINPDSVRILLKNKEQGQHDWKKSERMKFILLKALADDKCYVTHKSDSSLLVAIDYYKHHGTPHYRLLSYYLLGRTFFELHLIADAMKAFKQATQQDGVDHSDIYLARSYNNIGHIYMYQHSFNKAAPFFQLTYNIAKSAKDTSVMAFALRDIGRYYHAIGNIPKSIYNFEKSAQLIEKARLVQLYPYVYGELGEAYAEKGIRKKALICVSKLRTNHVKDEKSVTFYVIGEIYHSFDMTDSAKVYYKKAVAEPNIDSQLSAFYGLKQLCEDRKDYRSASIYSDSCLCYYEKIQERILLENENLITSLRNSLNIERENVQLREGRLLFGMFFLLLVIASVLISLELNKMKRQSKERIKELRILLGLNADSKYSDISSRVNELSKEVMDTYHLTGYVALFKETDLYRKLLEKTSMEVFGDLRDEDWFAVRAYLDENVGYFTTKLQTFYKNITAKEINVCCLIKLGFNNTQIANIFNQSEAAISNLRRRLYFKMFNKKASSEELNKFISIFPKLINE